MRTQLIRKDSHVTSLELSLTQKNEEIFILEEKIEDLNREIQNFICKEQNNNTHLKLADEIEHKERQIQDLTVELIKLKEITDEFEDQKFYLKAKLEKQEIEISEQKRLIDENHREQKDESSETDTHSNVTTSFNSQGIQTSSEKINQETFQNMILTEQNHGENRNFKADKIKLYSQIQVQYKKIFVNMPVSLRNC
jgi:chromosome segregation ATPase